jgi:hypothetical protein
MPRTYHVHASYVLHPWSILPEQWKVTVEMVSSHEMTSFSWLLHVIVWYRQDHRQVVWMRCKWQIAWLLNKWHWRNMLAIYLFKFSFVLSVLDCLCYIYVFGVHSHMRHLFKCCDIHVAQCYIKHVTSHHLFSGPKIKMTTISRDAILFTVTQTFQMDDIE